MESGPPSPFIFKFIKRGIGGRIEKWPLFNFTMPFSTIPIRSQYRVTLEEHGSTVVTPNFEEAKRLMAKVEEVGVVSSSPLNANVSTQLRIKAAS